MLTKVLISSVIKRYLPWSSPEELALLSLLLAESLLSELDSVVLLDELEDDE